MKAKRGQAKEKEVFMMRYFIYWAGGEDQPPDDKDPDD
jgi:hypothetical protein